MDNPTHTPREIKFRIFDNYRNQMVTGNLESHSSITGNYIDTTGVNGQNILMQFTGFKDRNGKEIYHFDKVKVFTKPMKDNYAYDGLVVWADGAWKVDFIDDFPYRSDLYIWAQAPEIEVTGNKFEQL